MKNLTAEKAYALAAYLEIDADDVENSVHELFDTPEGEYLVLTESEADEAWDESLDSYLDDCGVLDSIPENLRRYFNREAWKRDARFDGRGHYLAGYDGEEHDLGAGLVAFRTN